MDYTTLQLKDAKEAELLFYNTFLESEGEEEANAVSRLVKNYLLNYPRNDLRGYVAKENDEIVGCVFFSQMKYSNSDRLVYLLSPMAVKTNQHGKGIGQALIHYGHDKLKQGGINTILTYGDINFYSKVGYAHISTKKISAPLELSYPEGWLVNSLDGDIPHDLQGSSSCIPELNIKSLW